MTLDTITTALSDKPPKDADSRKRHASDDVTPIVVGAAGLKPTTEQVTKQPRATPSNNGWGDIFKDKATFVEKHLC